MDFFFLDKIWQKYALGSCFQYSLASFSFLMLSSSFPAGVLNKKLLDLISTCVNVWLEQNIDWYNMNLKNVTNSKSSKSKKLFIYEI